MNGEPRWLGVDAHGPGLSVALVEGGDALALVEWREPRSAGHRLMSWVEEIVDAFGPPDRVAVGIGPGSFTGVRVAVTAAKTLAWAWQTPLHAVSSLAAQAASYPERDVAILATAEYRAGRAYGGVYWRGAAGVEVLERDRLIEASALGHALRRYGRIVVVGPVSSDAPLMAHWPAAERGMAGSAAVGVVAAAETLARDPVSPLALAPAYGREPGITRPPGVPVA